MTEFEDHEGNGTVADALYAEENGGRGGEIEDQLDSKPKVIFSVNHLQSSDFWMFRLLEIQIYISLGIEMIRFKAAFVSLILCLGFV